MATTTKKTAMRTAKSKVAAVPAVDNTETEVRTEKVKRKFAPDDMIPCVSITPGEMFFVGAKTKELYTFAEADDVQDIAYQDLAYAARSRDKMMYKPRFIIQDDDFLQEFPVLEELYGTLYSAQDLHDLLKLSASQIKKVVPTLPVGAQEALQSIVTTMIDSGSFDSVQRIKVLDEIFGTEMLLRMIQ